MPEYMLVGPFGQAPLADDLQYVLVLNQSNQVLETLLWQRSNTPRPGHVIALHYYFVHLVFAASGTLSGRFPEGYVENLETGSNQLADPDLAEYLLKAQADHHWQDPQSTERLKLILEMNLGKYDQLIENYFARQSTPAEK